ncbi:MAG: gliding motility-associated C-terminal domain-containing protein [Bacteroidetes bacterium]|nr:gliding motility-associated C-terminal domain-containing protein [Bacteroidota bacterium]
MEVTDANNCPVVYDTATVVDPTPIVLDSISIVNVSCNGLSNGQITIFPTGGAGSYTYSWPAIPPNPNTLPNPSNLAAGYYTVFVFDVNTCQEIRDSIQVTEPSLLVLADTTLTDTCGKSVGIAIVNVSGGTVPYTYSWNTLPVPQVNDTATGLLAGQYTVTVTDTNGCVVEDSLFVGNLPGPVIDTFILIKEIFCSGDSTGSVLVQAKEGNPPYLYNWSPIGVSDSIVDSLSASIWYNVTITDGYGCTTNDSILLTEPDPVGVIFDTTNASCLLVCDGQVTIIPSGGTPPYQYSWNNDPKTKDSVFTGLCGNKFFTVIVSDSFECESIIDSVMIIADPNPVNLTFTSNNTSCDRVNNGQATVIPAGGLFPYTYEWNNDTSLTDPVLTGLSTGVYTVTVTDSNGCSKDSSVTIIADPNPVNLTFNTINASCDSVNNGIATVSSGGGLPPFTFEWDKDTSLTDPVLTGLSPGVYTVIVTDSNGCSKIDSVTIAADNFPADDSVEITNVGCYGERTGAINLTITGGMPPYNYLWSNGDTTQNIDGLPADTFIVSFSDSIGCSGLVASIVITQPTKLLTDTVIVNCDESETTLRVKGGTLLYTYLWKDPDGQIVGTDSTVEYLVANTYYVTVTDANGCPMDTTVEVTCRCTPDPKTGFSPNDDNVNEFWVIDSIGGCKEIQVTIFNRWGDIVWKNKDGEYINEFNPKNFEEGHVWDGTYYKNDLPVPDGTYFYVIETPFVENSSGWVYIQR